MNIVVLLAGGMGSRMGQDIPKQFIHVNNIPVIIYTMLALEKHPEVDAIQAVCIKGWEVVLSGYAEQFNITKLRGIVSGGATRFLSTKAGMMALGEAPQAVSSSRRPCTARRPGSAGAAGSCQPARCTGSSRKPSRHCRFPGRRCCTGAPRRRDRSSSPFLQMRQAAQEQIMPRQPPQSLNISYMPASGVSPSMPIIVSDGGAVLRQSEQ